jgi:hypothetical protein
MMHLGVEVSKRTIPRFNARPLEGTAMRHLLLVALAALFTATAAPAFATSIFDFSHTGTVSSDVTFSSIGHIVIPSVFGQGLTGAPVHISESFDLAKADLVYQRSYIGSLGNRQFASSEITIGNVSAPFRGDGGRFTPTLGGFSSEIFTKADSQIASTTFVFLDYSSNFTPNGVLAGGSLEFTEIGVFARTLDFSVSSETLPPLLSPVPLPPALPLFAAALLALGIVSYARGTKGLTAAQT